MTRLWSEFLNNSGRLIDKWKHYFPAYEAHLSRFVDRPLLFVEIGCGEGGSLHMWKRYFGPHAQIVGLDIDPRCGEYEDDQIAIRIGDQADPVFLESVIEEFSHPDVVLDDGSHQMRDLAATFQYLYPRVTPCGLYIVEDLHTSYWDEYGGGLQRRGTFIEFCKSMLDELNAEWTRGAMAPTQFTRSTLSMHFYDSMVVFERGRCLKKSGLQTGATQ
jgi:SAM-dependent methyltransferase